MCLTCYPARTLSFIMVQLTTQQRVFVVKNWFATRSYVEVFYGAISRTRFMLRHRKA